MSLTGSLSDLQISIPFSVPSVSGLGVHACAGLCHACAAVGRVPCGRVPTGSTQCSRGHGSPATSSPFLPLPIPPF